MQDAATEKLAYTIRDLTERGIGSPAFLYKEIASGKLRAVKSGRSTRIIASDLDAYLKALPPAKVGENAA